MAQINGTHLALGGYSGNIYIHDLRSLEQTASWLAHSTPNNGLIQALLLLENGLLLSAGNDGYVKTWNLTNIADQTLDAPTASVSFFSGLPVYFVTPYAGGYVLIGGFSGDFLVYDFLNGPNATQVSAPGLVDACFSHICTASSQFSESVTIATLAEQQIYLIDETNSSVYETLDTPITSDSPTAVVGLQSKIFGVC